MASNAVQKKTTKSLRIKSEGGILQVHKEETEDLRASEVNLAMFGVEDSDIFNMLLTQTTGTIPSRFDKDDTYNYVMAMLLELKPQDSLEALLISQMIATQSLAMEMAMRAGLAEQTVEGVNDNINRTTKLQRTFIAQMESLLKKRGKGKQVIQVQHVTVNDGGQAVVGNVQGGVGE